jgi:hypothetical protein
MSDRCPDQFPTSFLSFSDHLLTSFRQCSDDFPTIFPSSSDNFQWFSDLFPSISLSFSYFCSEHFPSLFYHFVDTFPTDSGSTSGRSPVVPRRFSGPSAGRSCPSGGRAEGVEYLVFRSGVSWGGHREVAGCGYARIERLGAVLDARHEIHSVSPSDGSELGGSLVTVRGVGFPDSSWTSMPLSRGAWGMGV